MSYQDVEVSAHDGEPIELYRFEGVVRNYYYTTHDRDIQKDDALYEAIPMKRSSFSGGGTQDPPEMTIELPVEMDVVQDYAFGIARRLLSLTIYRRHGEDGEDVVFWTGKITKITVDNRTAKITIPSIFASQMASSIPNIYYQTQCNHVLYGPRCSVNRVPNRVQTQITAYGGKLTLAVASIGAFGDAEFNAGEIVRAIDGERRLIVEQTGPFITIAYPFRELLVGDNVEIFRGCDHTLADCHNKFNNAINFGGHPTIPTINPFATPRLR